MRHEHVIERRWMIEFLHGQGESVDDALWNYSACLVTVPEHMALGKTTEWGWRRYMNPNLQVLDAETGHHVDLSAADLELRNRYSSMGAQLE